MSSESRSSKVWFITGASSGFGLEVTEAALAHGDRVFATLRNPSALADLKTQYSASQLCVYQLDVTHEDKIGPAFAQAISEFGRVNVVLNNAGCSVIAEAEGISDANARRQFEVMFWGASYVTREAVRTFREQVPSGGKLLQVSSRTAIEAPPGVVHYAAANAALESLTEGYAQEVDKAWNIWFTILEPALFKTSQAKNNVFEPQHPAYTSPELPTSKYRALFPAASHFTGDATKFAKVVLDIASITDKEEWPFRVPLHRVSLEAARKKGHKLLDAAETQAYRLQDIYLDATD